MIAILLLENILAIVEHVAQLPTPMDCFGCPKRRPEARLGAERFPSSLAKPPLSLHVDAVVLWDELPGTVDRGRPVIHPVTARAPSRRVRLDRRLKGD